MCVGRGWGKIGAESQWVTPKDESFTVTNFHELIRIIAFETLWLTEVAAQMMNVMDGPRQS